jgi:diguanylate cyclase (GGDEF)-like protein
MRRSSDWVKLYFLAGLVLAGFCLFGTSADARSLGYTIAAASLVPTLLIAMRRHRLDPRICLVVALVSIFSILAQLTSEGSINDSSVTSGIFSLLAATSMVAALLAILRRSRDRRDAFGVLGDGAIVGLGSWVVTWIVFVQPMVVDRPDSLAAAMLFSFYLPMSSVVLFILSLLIFSSRRKSAALNFLAASLVFSMIGDIIYALIDIKGFDQRLDRFSLAAYVVAYFCAGAMFIHPSITRLLQPEVGHGSVRVLGRLVLTTSSLIIPVIALSATSPHDNDDRWVRAISASVLAAAVTLRVVRTVRANNAAQDELLRSAQTDPLTMLPNRTLLLQQTERALTTQWGPDRLPTLYFIDLDRFKNINDSLGHATGDELLVIVASRLTTVSPQGSMVARLSGGEFVILDTSSRNVGAAVSLAERFLAVFREPFALAQGDVFVTASLGVASASAGSTSTAEDLLRHADTAMYRAKDAGRNCMAVYDESMHERIAHRLTVETALYRALDRRELRLYHQPILDLTSGDVIGFEALMRWQQADGTIVSPAEFIPIAEETGTIVPIGAWALLDALTQLRGWIDEGVCDPSATMSVNVSPRQLSDPNFPSIVSEALVRSDVPAQQLWLEVTESMMISDPELALATLRRLRSIGVRFALDDFGTGYSSLSLLQNFPLHRIKIDRGFVHGVADNPNDRALVRTIVAMGSSLGLDIVAEGVESVHQLQVLTDLGCHKAQGYLISHPVPADAMRSTVSALERLGRFPGLPAARIGFNTEG